MAHPGLIRKRGMGWQVVLRVGGKRHQYGPRTEKLLASCTKNEAEEFAWRKLKELKKEAERAAAGLPGPMPISALLDKYERERLPLLAEHTRRTYKVSLAYFRTFFVERLGDPRVDKIRAGHVTDYLNWRRLNPGKGEAVGARTLAKDRATLHAVFAFAEELELREGNPVAKVRPPKADARQPVILSDEQFEQLLAACERDAHGHKLAEAPMLRLYILALAESGARCDSEVLWLRWEDVDFEGGFIKIESSKAKGRRTKSGKSRWVPMTPRLRQAMREHALRYRGALYDGKPSPWAFHHPFSRRRAKAGERVRSFRRGFQAAAARAKLPPEMHQHDLRHRRVTTWLAAGANPVHVKEAVGHADLRTTMGYTHLAREHLRALVDGVGTEAPPATLSAAD
ncbi:MAG TPA: tyrosine-type recombinase/integrase [Longimicrobiales bacterium]|nr:tyrosine-type recombinase/integrase [Longimicrobiales bacterium]